MRLPAYKVFKKGGGIAQIQDEKTINHAVNQAELKQQRKPAYKPNVDRHGILTLINISPSQLPKTGHFHLELTALQIKQGI